MLKIIITILFGIIFGFICAKIFDYARKKYENNKSKNNENPKNKKQKKYEKLTTNLHMNILIVTCNTILYCVLYYKNSYIFQSSNAINYIDFALYCIFITSLIYLSMVDVKYKRISNKLNVFLLILGMANILITYILYKNITQILTILATGGVLFFIMYLVRMCSNGSLGGGDVKFISILPLYFNYVEVMYIILIASIVGSLVGIYLMIIKKKTKKHELAYGLFLSIGCIAILLFS